MVSDVQKSKEIVIFDLDGTLALSKSAIDDEMVTLLEKLLDKKRVLIISGGKLKQFEKQVVEKLKLSDEKYQKLFISPGSGSSMYRFVDGQAQKIYADSLSEEDKNKIYAAFYYALDKVPFNLPDYPYGERLEDRQTQVTFSALGQQAPLKEKDKWDPDRRKRELLVKFLVEKIPEFEIRIGGTTSIDITKKGIDKAYGIRRAGQVLGIPKEKILFVGDALFPGGNDAPAKEMGVECIQVKNVEETKQVIREIIG